jgi:hypothetical protein
MNRPRRLYQRYARLIVDLALVGVLGLPGPAAAQVNAGPYVPTPDIVVEAMLRLARVGPRDFLIDLGSGDGRIVITAAKKFGARGFGVDIDESLVRLSNHAAAREGVGDRVRFYRQDLFQTSIGQATVVTLYLLPDMVNRLRDKLGRELRPGTRVVSHDYPITGWVPERTESMDVDDKINATGVPTTSLYLYVVPAQR